MVSEAEWEQIALEALYEHEWTTAHGPQIAPDKDRRRTSWDDLILRERALARLKRLNPAVPADCLAQALADILAPRSQDPIARNYQAEDMLAQTARDVATVMRRDIKTDWTLRDDVRAKLRSSTKRLLVKYQYPPDQQPEAIRLVIEQMESLAPRMAG